MVLLRSLEFLKSLCFVIAAVVVAFFPQYSVEAGTLLAAVLAVLHMLGIYPELRAKGLL